MKKRAQPQGVAPIASCCGMVGQIKERTKQQERRATKQRENRDRDEQWVNVRFTPKSGHGSAPL
ncbi:MAG: hypothetical protein WBO12_20795 [Xanthobacteraceae bacterium]|jgi:hypothetical protein